MLTITVPGIDAWDDDAEVFTTIGDTVLELKHSLVSLSKWESIFEKPFLDAKTKTPEEIVGYIKAMTLTPGVSDDVYARLSEDNVADINAHIDAKMTATWFSDSPGAPRASEIVTSELIYYWMTVFSIDFKCEDWHLNRLFTLIRICNNKQSKPKKMSRSEAAARQRELNEKRKAQYSTSG